MSKASEWVKVNEEYEAARPKRFRDIREGTDRSGPYIGARVDELGRCVIIKNGCSEAWLEADAALALASWILDTFSEAPK